MTRKMIKPSLFCFLATISTLCGCCYPLSGPREDKLRASIPDNFCMLACAAVADPGGVHLVRMKPLCNLA